MLAGLATTLTPGCASLFQDDRAPDDLASLLAGVTAREIATLPSGVSRQTDQPGTLVEDTLAERRDELERLSPATDASPTAITMGPDLTGSAQAMVVLGLDQAIATGVRHNLAVQVTQIATGISSENITIEESAFDIVWFANLDASITDEPRTVPVVNANALGTGARVEDRTRFETGVRKRLYPGTQLFLSTDLSRLDNESPDVLLTPDPSYNASFRFGAAQPLLRGFGRDVNTSAITLAENTKTRTLEDLRLRLLDLAEAVESSYWQLALAWKELEVSQWLVDVGLRVRDDLEARRNLDVTVAQISDAVARIEDRQADVIRARRRVRAASDRLKLLLNDPDLSVAAEELLKPSDPFVVAPTTYDVRDAILTAIDRRPEIMQSLLVIDDTEIRELVADNARLPLLNVTGQIAYLGLDDELFDAYENTMEDDFIDYVFGMNFEYPFANRAAEARYRRARLERSQAIVAYQLAVQAIVRDVKNSLRNLDTNYELIAATKSARVAQAENLRTLIAEEPLRGKTPVFLNLRFERQESLARARLDEFAALVDYDQAIAAYYRATGEGLSRHDIVFRPVDGPEDAEHLPALHDATTP